jgi:hypothetical protein
LIFKVELKKKIIFLGMMLAGSSITVFILANILEQTTIFGFSFSLGASGGWGGGGELRYFW